MHADLAFELSERPHNGREGTVQVIGCTGQRAMPGNGKEYYYGVKLVDLCLQYFALTVGCARPGKPRSMMVSMSVTVRDT